jgi:hypothetical protein
MTRQVRIYLVLLSILVSGWLLHLQSTGFPVKRADLLVLAAAAALYIASHLLRMLRLALLTLDERDKAFALIAVHTLTAFPSSFLPFKIGEFLRLAAFFHVFDYRRKAFAIWLAERFGDVLVITAFIMGLYLFKVNVPDDMRAMVMFFALTSIVGLLGLFAVAKVFVYLNRHLVLTSYSVRGLRLLRASHALRLLEIDIHRSLEGRLEGFWLLSVLIWAFEIAALSLFMHHFSIGKPDFASMFASGLLATLPGSSVVQASDFGLYQSLALVGLTVLFLVSLWFVSRLKIVRL